MTFFLHKLNTTAGKSTTSWELEQISFNMDYWSNSGENQSEVVMIKQPNNFYENFQLHAYTTGTITNNSYVWENDKT